MRVKKAFNYSSLTKTSMIYLRRIIVNESSTILMPMESLVISKSIWARKRVTNQRRTIVSRIKRNPRLLRFLSIHRRRSPSCGPAWMSSGDVALRLIFTLGVRSTVKTSLTYYQVFLIESAFTSARKTFAGRSGVAPFERPGGSDFSRKVSAN